MIVGDGPINAKTILIGEAPGYNEDLQSLPFVGAAGKLLNEILNEAGIERDSVYITNVVKCRPPNNRKPRDDEIRSCSPYLEFQLSIIKPKVVITLGNVATTQVLKKFGILARKIGEIHGKKFRVNTLFGEVTIMPVYHPAAAIYTPSLRKEIVADLKDIESRNV